MSEFEAAVHARLEAIERSVKQDAVALHRKFDALLTGMHHLITTGQTDMSKFTDAIAAAASANADKAAKLIAYKGESDTSLQSVLDTLTKTNGDLDTAISEHESAGAATGQPAVTGAALTGAAVDPATGMPISG